MAEFLTGKPEHPESDTREGNLLLQLEVAGPDVHRAMARWLCEHEPQLVLAAVREHGSIRRAILLQIAEGSFSPKT